MKLPRLVLAAAFVNPTLAWGQTEDTQTWTASDGRVIQAKFVRYEADAVVIEKDGLAFTVPLGNLSPASMLQARKLGEAAAAKAPPAPKTDAVLHGTIATAPQGAPEQVARALAAGNTLQTKSYKAGGGRDSLDTTFAPMADKVVRTTNVHPDGKIAIGGRFTSLRPNGASVATPCPGKATLNANGIVASR